MSAKVSDAYANVDFTKIEFGFLIIVVVEITDVPANISGVERKASIYVVLIGINIARAVIDI